MQIDYKTILDDRERYALISLEMYHDRIYKKIANYRLCYDRMLIVTTNEGESYIYDLGTNGIRLLPDSSTMSKDTFSREFGRRVEYLLRQRRMTKTELANALDIDPGQLSKYLNGRVAPTFYMVDRIARVLDCSVDELRHLD